MSNGKDPATLMGEAWDRFVEEINETPPFSWVAAMADWAVDKLATILERATHKEDNMTISDKEERRPDCVTVTAAEAAENISKAMEAMNGPTLAERVREEFHQIFAERVNRTGANELLEWMERNGFFEAPASKGHHLAVPGGLAMHSLHVYRRLREIAAAAIIGHPCEGEFNLEGVLEESVAIMALLHDLCKIDCYHRSGDGYTFRDPLPLGHGEKSVYLITKYMKLMETEALAIRWHMGAYDDAVKGGAKAFNAAMAVTPWVWRLHQADMIATWEDERSGDDGRA